MPHRTSRLLAAAAATAVLVTGCSSSTPDDVASGSGSTEDAVTFDNCGQELTFTDVPSQVVILSGSSVAEVESFLALGIEDSIVANLQTYGFSDDPDMVDQIAALPTGGLTLNENFGPPAEQLLALDPDLVISTYPGGFDADSGFATRDELAAAGAQTLVPPTNCANGNPDATPEEQEVYDTTGVDSSYQLLQTLGRIFRVEDRADQVVDDLRSSLDATAAAIEGEPTVSGLVLSPGFGSDVPVAWTGGIYNDVLARAGVRNVYADESGTVAGTFSPEQLLVANPDVVVLFGAHSTDYGGLRAYLEAQFPDWPAIRSGSLVISYDGVYLGPNNAIAADKIARVAHPDAF